MRIFPSVLPWVFLGLLAASPAPGVYADDDVRAASPGNDWNLQTSVPDAPNLRAAWVKSRGEGKGTILTFGIDPAPAPPEPSRYVQKGFETLGKPPLNFKVGKKSEFQWKGNAAFRIEYTDSEATRHFAQAAIRTPRGGILIATLQAPDANSYKEDMPVFLAWLESVQLPPARVKTR